MCSSRFRIGLYNMFRWMPGRRLGNGVRRMLAPTRRHRPRIIDKHVKFLSAEFGLKHPPRVTLGRDVIIREHCNFAGNVRLGNRVRIGAFVTFWGLGNDGDGTGGKQDMIVMEDDSNVAAFTIIFARSHAYMDRDRTILEQGAAQAQPVIIKRDALVGVRSILLPGVTIGEGAVVAAGSVVTGDVPPYTMVAGNPARAKKERKGKKETR